MGNPVLAAAWNIYTQAVALLWQPLLAAAVRITRHPILWGLGMFVLVATTVGLKTYGVSWAEDVIAAGGTNLTGPRVLIGLAGLVELPVSAFGALVAGIILYWVVFAIGIIQVPLGELMEVLREIGQMLRVQDPVQRHGEGNIRAVNTRRLLEWGFVLLLVPGFSLMSTVWLAIAPVWKVYALLLLITGVGLTYGVIAQARGRKVGAGIDLILGMNGMLFLLGVQGILLSLFLPRWTEVLFGGALGSTLTVPHASGIDGLLGNVWARLFEGWITWWPPAAGDVAGLVIGGLLLAGLIALNVFAVRVLVRMLTRPPERETNGVTVASALPADAVVSGTVGKGDAGGFTGFEMNGWLWGAIGLGVTAVILWLVNHHVGGEWVCRFGSQLFTLAWVFGLAALVAGLLQQRWPRFAAVAGTLALCVAAFVFVHDALGHWDGRRTACGVDERPARTAAAAPVHDAPRTEPSPPARRSGPARSAPSDEARIRAYFAEHGAMCPQTAADPWHRLHSARAACEIEANRRDHPTIFATVAR